jgi:hypothetical protein
MGSTLTVGAATHTRSRFLTRRAVALLGIATLAVVAVLSFAALGGQARSGPLGWSGDVDVFTHPTIPGDRVLTGTLRNDDTHPLRVDIGDLRLLADDGSVVPSAPVFLKTFGKSLWGAGHGPQQVPDTELLRTGRIALLSPGEEVPITIAWHDKDGTPARIDYGEGSLAIGG